MSNSILNELPALLKANVITEETAQKIKEHYTKNGDESQSKLFMIFGILGAILSGLGIILILAHNWDDLSNYTKSILSFLPLVIGQLFCGYTILKKAENTVWRESSSVFLFFGIGASISLIAQVYNISGDLNSFLLTWMLLSLPLVYLLRTSIVSLLYLIGITYYCCNSNYFTYPKEQTYLFWLLFLGITPHYYQLLTTKSQSNFTLFHNWFVAISLMISLGSVRDGNEKILYLSYMCLFAIYYFIGKSSYFDNQKLKFNSYRIIGKLGTLILLFVYTFKSFWIFFHEKKVHENTIITSPEFIIASILTIIAAILFYKKINKTNFKDFGIIEIIFLLNILLILMGELAAIVANGIVLAIGLLEIKRGNQLNNLRILNFGLLIITILITCRFFDTDFSFIVRGILFISLGLGFFLTNYVMLKKRNRNEK
ncbi:DUF2157 domain-containing protein [Flavobacterium alvei]|uniref:DUF2157 domain-containing protein n=1 Tax=Flavobacterium alvei TaxID=2080416 RepID=UPI0026EBD36A|nr:DUF2157 domain-containing protein [Flavobacterium alvei]